MFWLRCRCFKCVFLSLWCLGRKVLGNCIDSWLLHSFLFIRITTGTFWIAKDTKFDQADKRDFNQTDFKRTLKTDQTGLSWEHVRRYVSSRCGTYHHIFSILHSLPSEKKTVVQEISCIKNVHECKKHKTKKRSLILVLLKVERVSWPELYLTYNAQARFTEILW